MRIKAYLDTNVLMDVLQEGRPSSADSRMIFQAILDRKIEAVLSTQSIIDASYLAQKTGIKQEFFNTVNKCCDYINMDQINTFDLRHACKNYSGDFEDDAQLSRALDTFCDVFVTNDKQFRSRQDGKHKNLRFMSPEEFVAKMKGQA